MTENNTVKEGQAEPFWVNFVRIMGVLLFVAGIAVIYAVLAFKDNFETSVSDMQRMSDLIVGGRDVEPASFWVVVQPFILWALVLLAAGVLTVSLRPLGVILGVAGAVFLPGFLAYNYVLFDGILDKATLNAIWDQYGLTMMVLSGLALATVVAYGLEQIAEILMSSPVRMAYGIMVASLLLMDWTYVVLIYLPEHF